MSYNNDLGAAIGWDDELTAEEASFALLEPGDYPFVVESVARKQFDGSAKMAPCFIEELSLNSMARSSAPTGRGLWAQGGCARWAIAPGRARTAQSARPTRC